MALSQSVQTQISFKNLSGKSHTDPSKDLYNESFDLGFNIPSNNVWTSRISPTPSVATLDGITVKILADLVPIEGSNGHAFYTSWPSTLPNEFDYSNGLSFSYGLGSLVGITGGDRMINIISDSYGSDYFVTPYIGSGTNPIEGLDIKRWIYQYNSGIFYQDNVVGPDPTTVEVYPYLGKKFDFPEEKDNIRISASGSSNFITTVYSSISVSPSISTYSTNHLYLIDFNNPNAGIGVSLNISNLGTQSVYKWQDGSWSDLTYGDINSGRIYFLTWNGNHFQFGDVNPIAGANDFNYSFGTNFTVGGVQRGSFFDSVPLNEVFASIFYDDTLGGINSFALSGPSGSISNLEIGDSLPATSLTFSWSLDNQFNIVPNARQITRNGGGFLTFFGNVNGPFTWVNTSTFSYSSLKTETFKLQLKRPSGLWITSVLNVNWLYPIYYGSTTSGTVSDASGMTKVLATGSNFTLTIPGSGYKYIYIPASYSSIYSLKSLDMGVAMAGTSSGYTFSDTKSGSFGTNYTSLYYGTLDIGNVFGVTSSYKVFRTENQISSDLTVVSKESL